MSPSKGRTKKKKKKQCLEHEVSQIHEEDFFSLEMMPSTASQTIHEVDLFFVIIHGSVSTAFNGARRCYLAEGQASTLP